MDKNPDLKFNPKSLIPIIFTIIGFILSPDFYNVLPDKYAHIIAGIALVISMQFPQFIHKKKDVTEETREIKSN